MKRLHSLFHICLVLSVFLHLLLNLLLFINRLLQNLHAFDRFIFKFLVQGFELLFVRFCVLLRVHRLRHAETTRFGASAHPVDIFLKLLELSFFLLNALLHLFHFFVGLTAVLFELALLIETLLGLIEKVIAVGLRKLALYSFDLLSHN